MHHHHNPSSDGRRDDCRLDAGFTCRPSGLKGIMKHAGYPLALGLGIVAGSQGHCEETGHSHHGHGGILVGGGIALGAYALYHVVVHDITLPMLAAAAAYRVGRHSHDRRLLAAVNRSLSSLGVQLEPCRPAKGGEAADPRDVLRSLRRALIENDPVNVSPPARSKEESHAAPWSGETLERLVSVLNSCLEPAGVRATIRVGELPEQLPRGGIDTK